MKKILFIDHDKFVSGSSVSLKYITKKFVTAGYIVTVLTPKSTATQKPFHETGASCIPSLFFGFNAFALDLHFSDNFTIFSVNGLIMVFRNVLKFLLGMSITFFCVLKVKPDFVYINEYVSIHSSVVSKLLGIPTAIHIRSLFNRGTFGIRKFLLSRLILKCSDLIFPITEIEANQISPSHSTSNQIKIVREFVSESHFLPQSIFEKKRELRIPQEKYIVTFLGGIHPIKGTSDYISSIKLLTSSRKDVHFILVGKNHTVEKRYSAECMKEIENLNSHVSFLGEVDDTSLIIACSDVLVSLNTQSHFSRPLIEAWSMKKPVVATNTAHTLELVDHQKNGIIVQCGDSADICQGILSLLENESLAKEFGDNGYIKARKYFDETTNLDLIYNYCTNAIEGPQSK